MHTGYLQSGHNVITSVRATVRNMHGVCNAGRGRGWDAAEQAAAEPARQAALLHADLIASTRKDDERISIGGWYTALHTAYAACPVILAM